MNLIFHIIILISLPSIIKTDVCRDICSCPKPSVVNCDGKAFTTITNLEFPSSVATLTLNNNKLKFDKSK